jgi:signal transduction histidine kinase
VPIIISDQMLDETCRGTIAGGRQRQDWGFQDDAYRLGGGKAARAACAIPRPSGRPSVENRLNMLPDMHPHFVPAKRPSTAQSRPAVQARQEQHDFVAMVSHEFLTPLAIINTVTQQLAGNLDAPRDKSLQRCTNIRESARRMTDMMDEFLSLDRVGGEPRLNRSPVDLRQLIDIVAQEWEPARLQVTTGNLPDDFTGDGALLRVALRNLLANAMRHSPENLPVQLKVCGTDSGGVTIEVADKGSSIPVDEIPKLFQKYFRGRAAQTQPGAGLGLYLVESIAKLHDGSLRAESAPGQGSVFVLTLATTERRASA